MKLTMTFEGDYYEDREDFQDLMKITEMRVAIYNAREEIRGRLKWASNLDADEIRFLEDLLQSLYIEGIER